MGTAVDSLVGVEEVLEAPDRGRKGGISGETPGFFLLNSSASRAKGWSEVDAVGVDGLLAFAGGRPDGV